MVACQCNSRPANGQKDQCWLEQHKTSFVKGNSIYHSASNPPCLSPSKHIYAIVQTTLLVYLLATKNCYLLATKLFCAPIILPSNQTNKEMVSHLVNLARKWLTVIFSNEYSHGTCYISQGWIQDFLRGGLNIEVISEAGSTASRSYRIFY